MPLEPPTLPFDLPISMPVLSDTLGGDGEVVRRHSGW
jgi:hypothetical protein